MTTLPVERRTPMPPPRFHANPRDPDRELETLTLAALPDAAGSARRFVVAQARKWGLDHLDGLVDACELVASELVTNSVTETGHRTAPPSYVGLYDDPPALIIMRLRLTWHRLVCEVWDRSPMPPIPSDPGLLAENGRGLLMIAAYATDWGSYPSPAGGKVVLAWWDLPDPSSPAHPVNPVDPLTARRRGPVSTPSGPGR